MNVGRNLGILDKLREVEVGNTRKHQERAERTEITLAEKYASVLVPSERSLGSFDPFDVVLKHRGVLEREEYIVKLQVCILWSAPAQRLCVRAPVPVNNAALGVQIIQSIQQDLRIRFYQGNWNASLSEP